MLSCKTRSVTQTRKRYSHNNSMKAWQKSLDAKGKLRFLGDASGAFTKALDTQFDATAIMGNVRSKRFAIQTEDGKVTSVAIEPDNTGITSKCPSTLPGNFGSSY